MRTLLYATTIALAVLIGQIAALPVETNLVETKPVETKPNLGMLKEETDHKYFRTSPIWHCRIFQR